MIFFLHLTRFLIFYNIHANEIVCFCMQKRFFYNIRLASVEFT
jgi:hypothetical protein